jgi:hypothetical protein
VRSCAQRGGLLLGSISNGYGETVISISTSVFVSLQADESPASVQALRKRYYLHPLQSYYWWPSIILRQSRRRPTGYWRGSCIEFRQTGDCEPFVGDLPQTLYLAALHGESYYESLYHFPVIDILIERARQA